MNKCKCIRCSNYDSKRSMVILDVAIIISVILDVAIKVIIVSIT
jgi:hypothetical protein